MTDFGLQDSYVGVMKAVLRGLAPTITIDDLCHAVPAQDLEAAAFQLFQALPWLPDRSLTVVVVDPGVGSDRRLALVRATQPDGRERLFLAPDNGVVARALGWLVTVEEPANLWLADPVNAIGAARIEQLTLSDAEAAALLPKRFGVLPPFGRTFDGRDRFAPLAARLAGGSLEQAIPAHLTARWQPLAPTVAGLQPEWHGERLAAQIMHCDRFGNGITNLTIEQYVAARHGRAGKVKAGTAAAWRLCWRRRSIPLVATYAAAPDRRSPVALVGSTGLIELAINGGSFAAWAGACLQAAAGRTLWLEPDRAPGAQKKRR